eukprot:1810509-Rhodomonas_salina.1
MVALPWLELGLAGIDSIVFLCGTRRGVQSNSFLRSWKGVCPDTRVPEVTTTCLHGHAVRLASMACTWVPRFRQQRNQSLPAQLRIFPADPTCTGTSISAQCFCLVGFFGASAEDPAKRTQMILLGPFGGGGPFGEPNPYEVH